ncbi:NARF domain-containing protein [Clostridium sp. FP1]|uniref:NARF domain-containing protein n=1 Tax=Clostridium sp. FP1 TaxID=2724076 RepID=UPI0013E99BEC|nr:NARF domain-containing protein [Clostridium sp. FP1]MBZ9634067.1 hypothetical protein [Clostridium sp. FP1]
MKKVGVIFALVAFMIMFSCPVVYGTNEIENKTIREIEEKIRKYDDIISNYDIKSKELNIELDKNKNEIMEKFNILKSDWTNEKIELERKKESVDRTLICIGIVLTMLGFVSFREAKIMIDKKVNETVDNYLNTNVDKLKKIIEVQDYEKKLIDNKKIIVLSKGNNDKNEIVEILKSFKATKYETMDRRRNYDKYDLICFNDAKGNIEHSEIEQIIKDNKNNKKLAYFYFNNSRKQFITQETEHLNFASSKSTLYTNLINMLKYQDNVLLAEKK